MSISNRSYNTKKWETAFSSCQQAVYQSLDQRANWKDISPSNYSQSIECYIPPIIKSSMPPISLLSFFDLHPHFICSLLGLSNRWTKTNNRMYPLSFFSPPAPPSTCHKSKRTIIKGTIITQKVPPAIDLQNRHQLWRCKIQCMYHRQIEVVNSIYQLLNLQ